MHSRVYANVYGRDVTLHDENFVFINPDEFSHLIGWNLMVFVVVVVVFVLVLMHGSEFKDITSHRWYGTITRISDALL